MGEGHGQEFLVLDETVSEKMKHVWTFRRLSFTPCPRREKDVHETVEEFIIMGKDFFESSTKPFGYICRFCKHLMPEEGRWQVSTELATKD